MRRRAAGIALAAAVVAASAVALPAGSPAVAVEGDVYSARWQLDGPRRPASRTVRVHWVGGGYACEWRFLRATATETRRSVTIRVLLEHHPMGPGEVCAAVVAEGRARVRLRRPLGSRRLRHAPVTMPQ